MSTSEECLIHVEPLRLRHLVAMDDFLVLSRAIAELLWCFSGLTGEGTGRRAEVGGW